jgi:hypothetical protein
MFVGGLASNYFGSPRPTYDLDVVLAHRPKDVEKFIQCLKEVDIILDEAEIRKLIPISNRLILEFGIPPFRVDFGFAEGEFGKSAINRRVKVYIFNTEIYIISLEDLIIEKLRSGRPRDIEDVTSIILRQKDSICWEYVKRWTKILHVDNILNNIIKIIRE